MIPILLIILILAGLASIAWSLRAIGRELDELGENSKRGPDMSKEIAKWEDRE